VRAAADGYGIAVHLAVDLTVDADSFQSAVTIRSITVFGGSTRGDARGAARRRSGSGLSIPDAGSDRQPKAKYAVPVADERSWRRGGGIKP
jgi:hypothetical protein